MRWWFVAVVTACGGSGDGNGDGGTSCAEPRSCILASLTGGNPRPTSTVCIDGTQVPERQCPGSPCASGYCVVPEGSVACTSDGDCPLSICTPFVVQGELQTYCAATIGSKFSGERCINDIECLSGVCIAERGTCFGRCPAAGQPCNSATICEDVQITVEGTQATLPSCVR